MLEATEFNGWFYGTDVKSLSDQKINIGVFNPAGIEAMSTIEGIKVIPIYVDVKDKTRLLRQLNREENPNVHEIIRRFKTDIEDFDVVFAEDIEHYGIIQNEDNMFPHNVEILAEMLRLGKKR